MDERYFFNNTGLVKRVLAWSPDLISILDLEHCRVLYENGRAASYFGLSAMDYGAEGFDLLERIVHIGDLKEVRMVMEKLRSAEDDEVFSVTFRSVKPDGVLAYFSANMHSLERGKDGKVRFVVAMVRDVTAQEVFRDHLEHEISDMDKEVPAGPSADMERLGNMLENLEQEEEDKVQEVAWLSDNLQLLRESQHQIEASHKLLENLRGLDKWNM